MCWEVVQGNFQILSADAFWCSGCVCVCVSFRWWSDDWHVLDCCTAPHPFLPLQNFLCPFLISFPLLSPFHALSFFGLLSSPFLSLLLEFGPLLLLSNPLSSFLDTSFHVLFCLLMSFCILHSLFMSSQHLCRPLAVFYLLTHSAFPSRLISRALLLLSNKCVTAVFVFRPIKGSRQIICKCLFVPQTEGICAFSVFLS